MGYCRGRRRECRSSEGGRVLLRLVFMYLWGCGVGQRVLRIVKCFGRFPWRIAWGSNSVGSFQYVQYRLRGVVEREKGSVKSVLGCLGVKVIRVRVFVRLYGPGGQAGRSALCGAIRAGEVSVSPLHAGAEFRLCQGTSCVIF